MPSDKRIRRAAGVIMWHLENGDAIPTAVRSARIAEPGLKDDQLSLSLQWAEAALTARDLVHGIIRKGGKHMERTTMRDIMDLAGLPLHPQSPKSKDR